MYKTRKMISILFFAAVLSYGQVAGEKSGTINVNPDPNGDPWIAGGITR